MLKLEPHLTNVQSEQNRILFIVLPFLLIFICHKKNALAVSCLCQPTSRNVFCISSLGSESDPKSVPFLQHGPCLVICFDGLWVVTNCSGQESSCRLTKNHVHYTRKVPSVCSGWLITWGMDEIMPPALRVLTHSEEERVPSVACH